MEDKYLATPTPHLDLPVIEKTLKEIIYPQNDRLIELRAFSATRKDYASVGFFTSIEECLKSLKNIPKGQNICVGLNPRPIELLHKFEPNRLIPKSLAAKDSDIQMIEKVFVDIDTRKILKDCSATDAEIEVSKKAKQICLDYLKSLGVTKYIDGFSGNGHHILFDIEPTSDPIYWDKEKSPTRKLLTKLNELCSEFADIDTTVYNPSRIIKLYGTPAIKGRSTLERPHRLSNFQWKEII